MLFFSHFEGTRGEKNIIVNFIIKKSKSEHTILKNIQTGQK